MNVSRPEVLQDRILLSTVLLSPRDTKVGKIFHPSNFLTNFNICVNPRAEPSLLDLCRGEKPCLEKERFFGTGFMPLCHQTRGCSPSFKPEVRPHHRQHQPQYPCRGYGSLFRRPPTRRKPLSERLLFRRHGGAGAGLQC